MKNTTNKKTLTAKKVTAKKTTRNTSQQSVENGIKVIKTALKKKVSLAEASRLSNYGRNYVSDIKANITENYKNKNVDKETYQAFKTLIKEYSN